MILTFANTHSVIMSEKILLKEMGVKVRNIPEEVSAGCGLCLEVDEQNLERAKNLLKAQNIEIEGIVKT